MASEQENENGDGEARSGDDKPQKPTDIGLDIDDDGERNQESYGKREVPPVEETLEVWSSLLCSGVELIGSEGYVAGPDAARAEG